MIVTKHNVIMITAEGLVDLSRVGQGAGMMFLGTLWQTELVVGLSHLVIGKRH